MLNMTEEDEKVNFENNNNNDEEDKKKIFKLKQDIDKTKLSTNDIHLKHFLIHGMSMFF